jgi:hypothetical protein
MRAQLINLEHATEDFYGSVGFLFGVLGAFAAFIGGWWHCAATYGLLIGFGLGWFPSLVLAVIAFYGLRLLWLPALLVIVYRLG